MRGRRRAPGDPSLDAVQNRSKSEHVECHIEVQVGNPFPSGSTTIGRNILRFRWNRQGTDIAAMKSADDPRRQPVHHEMVGKVAKWMTQRGQFPIQHRNDPRLGWMENQVIGAKIAVYDGLLLTRWNVARQPVDEPVHIEVASRRLIREILSRPASDLAFKIIAAFSVIRQTDARRVEQVQIRNRGVHDVEIQRPLVPRQAGQRRIPEYSAVHHLHHVKPRADDGFIEAQRERARDGKANRGESANHPILALNGMRTSEELTGRLAPQYVITPGGSELVGGVGLSALELLDGERPRVPLHVRSKPILQLWCVDFLTRTYRFGSGKCSFLFKHQSNPHKTQGQTRSNIAAIPWPPPIHMVTKP